MQIKKNFNSNSRPTQNSVFLFLNSVLLCETNSYTEYHRVTWRITEAKSNNSEQLSQSDKNEKTIWLLPNLTLIKNMKHP